jgi:hypothetical protein
MSPNTKRFQDYFLSRLLKKFPFLVEAWYWALIYWVSKLASSTLLRRGTNPLFRFTSSVAHFPP